MPNLPTFLLIDGHSLAYRAYFAFAKSRQGGLKPSTGIPTSVCFGFLKSLSEAIATYKPECVAIAFDTKDPTFRHKADETYKADRAETPEDLIVDMGNLQKLLQAFNFPILTAPGYEADDILGTLADRASQANYTVKILSGDRDLFQLVDTDKHIGVLHLGGSTKNEQILEFTPEKVKEKLGVEPHQVVDYKALCGDKSDNIPGVRGIGEKTAVKLIQEYGSLEGIYAAIDRIPGANRKKLEAGKPEAYHSQFMAKIERSVPLDFDLETAKLQGFSEAEVISILEELELKQFIKTISKLQQQFGGQASKDIEETTSIELEDDDTWFFSAKETEASINSSSNFEESPIDPQIIDTPEKLKTLIQLLENQTNPENPVAWDTETTAIDPRDAKLVGIGCCWGSEKTEVAYLPISHERGQNLELSIVLDELKPILESAKYPKALQNAKFDQQIFRSQGIQLAGVVFDTMLASYVLNPENSHNLSDLSLRYLGIRAQSYSDLVPKGKTIADIDIPTVAHYCGLDAYTTFCLVDKLRAELLKIPQLHQLLLEIEQPLEPVLAEMEWQGIRIDRDYLHNLSQQLEKSLEKIEKQAHDSAGETFNLGSPKQLSQLLFEKLGLDTKKTRKTKTGYSTDATVLERLQGDHPVIDAVLEYRTLSKLKSTYVDALPALMRDDTQRVHTSFNQTVTATGRLSSSNPNLQNIPIRTEFSRKIRQAFIPQENWLLVSADYSQIELRILAHLSQEPVLLEGYQNARDVHQLTAQLIFEKEDVTPEERRLGKTINFGVIYGMGAQRFAREAGFSVARGKEFIDRYNQRYSRVFAYLQQIKREAIARGYVETLFGRRRYFQFESGSLRKLQGSDPAKIEIDRLKLGQYDSQLLRAAANAPIQGSSADIIKIAMVKLHEILPKYQARLLLQVHDELVFEVPPSEWEELEPKIRETMENAVTLSVPLVVDIHAGENWMEAK
ncbi:MAG: DNA polymerase I [Cyanobacteria bacterium J055]|nr:MAG: DNA polymerase I [Cyanobacteria bacterium J055]